MAPKASQLQSSAPEMFAYSPLSYPITGPAAVKLSTLARNSSHMPEIKKMFDEAIDIIHDATIEVNELTVRHNLDKSIADQRTKELEQAVRKFLDAQNDLDNMETALKKASEQHLPGAQIAQTQSRSQAPRNTQDEEDNIQLTNDTTSDEIIGSAPSVVFNQTFGKHKDDYQALGPYLRYSRQAHYAHFKQCVLEGQYPDGNAPNLPPADMWFGQGVSLAPGTAAADHQQADHDDDDDDVQTISVNMTTKDPITLQDIDNVICSTKCPHYYERDSILDYIEKECRRATNALLAQRRAGGPVTVVECPVAGCTQKIGKEDLKANILIARKIRKKREQDQNRMEAAASLNPIVDDNNIDEDFDQVDSDEEAPEGLGVKPEVLSSYL